MSDNTIKIKVHGEKEKMKREAIAVIWREGHFATHEAAAGSKRQANDTAFYVATHVPSGLCVTPMMSTEAHARVFAQWLALQDCDWSAAKPAVAGIGALPGKVNKWVQERKKAPSLAYVKRQAATLIGGAL